MSSIQYQLNKRYRIEMKQKVQEYHFATEHIRKQRTRLRMIFLPRIIMKNGICKYIYSDKFYKLDAELEELQNMIWDVIFTQRGGEK